MSYLYHDPGTPADGKQKVMLATTVYDTPSVGYVFSIQKSREKIHKAGINTAYLILQGNCSVDDSRNSVIQEFLLSDCTDLFFLDADVSWTPDSVIKLCRTDADLVGGIYPYRREGSQEKMPVLLVPGINDVNDNGLLQVAGLPAGFMRIRRIVIEKLFEKANKFWNKEDKRMPVPILFERTWEKTETHPKWGELGGRWGGDIAFCKKWHDMGGKIHAMPDLRLGHTGIKTMVDSLSASLRRTNGETLKYLVDFIRKTDFNNVDLEDLSIFTEARDYIGNKWGALEDVLIMCASLGKKAEGPIIETGTGLTSIVLAAATNQPVICLEHEPYFANRLQEMADEAGLTNIDIRICDLVNGFYQLPDDLPSHFALGLNDGPPRVKGDRMKFFDFFGDTDTIITDDADSEHYGNKLKLWCDTNARSIDFVERSALIRRKAA